MYITYLTIKAVIALIVTDLHCLEPRGMRNYTLWYGGAHLDHHQDQKTEVHPRVFLYKVNPLVVFTSIAIWKSRATSTIVFKFPGVLRRCHCQTMALGHSTAKGSQQEEAKNMESGVSSLRVWGCIGGVTSLEYDSLDIQFNSSSQPQTLSSPPATKQGHSLEWCWLKTVHNCKGNMQ